MISNFDSFIIGSVCINKRCMKLSLNKSGFCPHCKQNTLTPFYDFYQLFKLSQDDNEEDLKKSYKKLSLKVHPDVQNGNESLFVSLNQGYEILSDPSKRRLYDQSLLLLRNLENEENIKKDPFIHQETSKLNVNEEMVLKMLYEIFKNLNQPQVDPAVLAKKRRRINSILGLLLGAILGLIFDIHPVLMALGGFILTYNRSLALGKALFYLNDFFITFLAIKYTFQNHFNLAITLSIVFCLVVYFYTTQEWKRLIS